MSLARHYGIAALLWAMTGGLLVGQELGKVPIDKPTKKAQERTAQLKASAKLFRLDLHFHGDKDKEPYYGLTVPVVPQLAIDPFHPVVQITEEEAVKIIDQLNVDGFLNRATDKAPGKVPGERPCYTLTVRGKGKAEPVVYYENIGWGAPMLKRLDGIKTVVPDKATKAMDLLLGRLERHRKEWANGDGPAKIRVLFSEKSVQPEGDLPKDARKAGGPDANLGAFSKLVDGRISTVTVTFFDPKTLKGEKDTENFLRRLLTTPKGVMYNQIPWAQRLGVPTVAATVEHAQGKTGMWLVWDADQSIYCAYKDGAGRWWFGGWSEGEIPR